MRVLDTSVVSEIMRPQPDAAVLAWWDQQAPAELWLSAVVAAELMAGVARLPEGKRRQQLAQAIAVLLEQDFANQILAFDLAAASVYGDLVATREQMGRPIAMADAQREGLKGLGLGLALISPWTAE